MLAQRSSIILSCESVCSGVNNAMRYLTGERLHFGGPTRKLNPWRPHVNGTLSKNHPPPEPLYAPPGRPARTPPWAWPVSAFPLADHRGSLGSSLQGAAGQRKSPPRFPGAGG